MRIEIDLVYGMMCDDWAWQRFIDWCHINHPETKTRILKLPSRGMAYNSNLGFCKIADYMGFLIFQKKNGRVDTDGACKVGIGHSMGGLLVALLDASKQLLA